LRHVGYSASWKAGGLPAGRRVIKEEIIDKADKQLDRLRSALKLFVPLCG